MERSTSVQSLQLENVLITGGCGFIGINLIKYLADKPHQIRILDNLSTGSASSLSKLQSQNPRLSIVDLMIGDIRDRDLVSKSVKGVDVIVHLAANPSVVNSLENPKEIWDINVNGTINLLEASRENAVRRFILASSNAVLGEQTAPVDETKVPQPLSPYGASKLACEALCSAYYHSFGVNTVSLRFANSYGPYSEHKSNAIVRFIEWAKEDRPLIIFGDGNQTRDFVHVSDVCQAIYLALTTPDSILFSPNSNGTVFHIASGVEMPINELAAVIQEITKKELTVTHEQEREGEIKRSYSNINKAREILGFEPKVKLKEGLEGLWNYLP